MYWNHPWCAFCTQIFDALTKWSFHQVKFDTSLFTGLLLKKIEELNGEVAKMRKENFDLLKKQAVCTVFRNYCIEQVVSLQYHT